jgi:hypothetical protein
MYDNRPPEQQAVADGVLGHEEFDDAAVFEGPGQGNLMLDVQRAPGTPKSEHASRTDAIEVNINLEHSRGDLLRAQRNFDAYQNWYEQDHHEFLATQINRPKANSSKT